jgi:hypothetical protein
MSCGLKGADGGEWKWWECKAQVEARSWWRELRGGGAPFNDGQRTVVAVVLVNT